MEREAAGVLPARPLREAANRPLGEHLNDYLADLQALGRDDEHMRHVRCRMHRLLEECEWGYCRDVSGDSFQIWRRRQTHSPKTLNEYLATASAFCRWMERHGRIPENPLKHMTKVESRGREPARRALTQAEVRRLLEAAGSRKLAYLIPLFTGLRRQEVNALCWGDVDLGASGPVLRVRASTTKNKKQALIRIHQELAAELLRVRPREYLSSAAVLPDGVPSMKVMREDLAAANIPFIDERGRRADFHALRQTFGTNLTLAGVMPRVVMELMRHSDLKLTMKTYTDATQLPVADAVGHLPWYGQNNPLPQLLPQELVPPGQALSQSVIRNDKSEAHITPVNKGESHDLAYAVTRSHENGEWRREGDSNPRYFLGTHAFQACALNHSAISPSIQ